MKERHLMSILICHRYIIDLCETSHNTFSFKYNLSEIHFICVKQRKSIASKVLNINKNKR